jgi:hypothetical protein
MNAFQKMQNAKYEMQNAKSGDAPARHFSFCIKHFALNILPSSRAAITLTEVLISMGILTLGLLGAAALFPVGGYYMQKAEIADRGSAIAQAVMNDVVARGIISPKAWVAMVPSVPVTTAASPRYAVDGVDGKYTPRPPLAPPPNIAAVGNSFSRPFSEALAHVVGTGSDPVTISQQFGNAFVIDPLYVAASTVPGTHTTNIAAYSFPASAVRAFPRSTGSWNYYRAKEWDVWRVASVSSDERVWPIRRMTLQGNSGWGMDASTAGYYFRASDDLASDLPSRDDRPARQNWDMVDLLNNDGVPDTALNRQWTGDYSWIISVVPTTTAARDALAKDPEGFAYDVSVVVFYKRPLPVRISGNNNEIINDAAGYERTVSASVVSTGLSGGELLLQRISSDGNSSRDPFDNLRKGEWIMLCGPHPNSNAEIPPQPNPPRGEPRFVMNWYQVLSVETERSDVLTDPQLQRLIAVRGPQWPWQPAGDVSYSDRLSNSLCVGICRGAVAVHTKTMRLEGARGDGMAIVSPAGTESSRFTLR